MTKERETRRRAGINKLKVRLVKGVYINEVPVLDETKPLETIKDENGSEITFDTIREARKFIRKKITRLDNPIDYPVFPLLIYKPFVRGKKEVVTKIKYGLAQYDEENLGEDLD